MDEVFRVNSPPTLGVKEIKLTDDEDDPFSLDKPVSEIPITDSSQATNSTTATVTTSKVPESSSNFSFKKQTSVNGTASLSNEELDEDRDKFLEIKLSDPTKMGDGMGSYMVYKITTKVINKIFK